jgi:predicted dehydrogenase
MVRVAVIGYGYWGPNLVRNFYETPGANLTAVCESKPERLELVRARYPGVKTPTDFEEVLADKEIDAVVIATPVGTHYAMAKAALAAGKHVLVEKPLTANVTEAEDLVARAAKSRLTLMVDHIFVYSPAVRKMKEIVDSGQLGELLFVDSVRVNLGLFQKDVNVVWDLAPHDLSIIDYVVGRMPRSVATFGSAHADEKIEDVAYLNLDFGDKLIASFHVNWLSPVKIRYTILGGSKKGLVYNDLDASEKIKIYDSGITVNTNDPEGRRDLMISYRTGDVWCPRLTTTEPLRNMTGHFVECIEKGTTPITGGDAGLRLVRILDAAQRSIKAQGGRITL